MGAREKGRVGRGEAGKLWAVSPRAPGQGGVWVYRDMCQDTSEGPRDGVTWSDLRLVKGTPATALIRGREGS